MAALARFLLASSDAANRNLFIQREMANRGPAFDFLYERLWGPGIEFTAVLVERAAGGRLSQAEAGVRAALMITSLAGFGEGRAVIERAVSEGDRIDYAIAALNEQIDALVRSEEHKSELPSLMRSSYDVFCLKKKKHEETRDKVSISTT